MKHNFLKKLIATSVITSSIFSICPTTVLAAGVNYAGVGQTNGQWSKQGENWYYYVGGQLQKGWIYDRTGWYYADKNGVMQTGVVQIGGNIYLLADSGVMQTGTVVINGKVYTAGSDGVFYGDDLPVPTKSFDWYGTNDNIAHPSQVIDSSEDDSSSTNPVTAYDPLAPKEKFQVIFKDDDGEDLKIKNAKDGDTITLYKPTKKGYEFVEWNTKKNGDGEDYDYDDEIKVEKDIKLYAVWEEIKVTDDNAEELGIVKVQDITIVPEGKKKEITTDKGTLKFSVDVLPVNADNKKVDWSVESETGKATISNNGLLTAEENGVVIVKATAKDGSGITDSIRITISGQKSGSGSGEGDSGSGSGSGNGSGSGSGTNNGELPVIVGDEAIINNSTSTELMKGNTYSTIRIATNNKEITLQNIKANKIVINGGDNIILDNCQVNYIEVLRPGTNSTVTLRNGSTAQIVNIERGVTLAGTGYNKVNAKTDEVVVIDSSAVINTVNITELKSNVNLNGKVTTMNIASSAANSIIQGSGSIDKLVNDALNIKLGVSSVGSISGTVGGTNTSENGLINEVKKLQDITKLVDAIEKLKLKSSDKLSKLIDEGNIKEFNITVDNVTDDDKVISVNINKELSVEELQEILDRIPSKNSYKSEYEKLSFRLEKLNSSNSLSQQLRDARNHVMALEKAVAIDPTSTVKFIITATTDGAVEIVNSDSGMTVDKFTDTEKQDIRNLKDPERLERSKVDMYAYSQYFIDNLTPGLVDKDSLQRRINSASVKVTEGKNFKKLISRIKAGESTITVDDYKNAGITGVSTSNLKLVNKYIALNKDSFVEIPSQLLIDNNGKPNNYTITDAISKNKELINKEISIASETLKLANTAEKNISSARSEIDKFYTANSLVESKLTLDGVDTAKKIFDSAKTSKNNLDDYLAKQNITKDYKDYIENYDDMESKYQETEKKLKECTSALCRKEVNSLYVGEPIDKDGNFVGSYPDIVSNLTISKIEEIDALIKKIETEYSGIVTSDKLKVYGDALINASNEYNEFQTVLKSLENNISIVSECSNLSTNGGTLTKSEIGYTYVISFSSKPSDYSVESSYNVIKGGLGSIFVQKDSGKSQAVEVDIATSGGVYEIIDGSKISFNVASVIETTNTDGSISRNLQFTTIKDQTVVLKLQKKNDTKVYNFKVEIDKKIVGDKYSCTLIITRS